MSKILLAIAVVFVAAAAQASPAALQEYKAALAKTSNLEHGAELFRDCAACHAVDGRRPNFSRSHVRLLAKLERDDFVGLADFLSRSESSGPVAQVAQVR